MGRLDPLSSAPQVLALPIDLAAFAGAASGPAAIEIAWALRPLLGAALLLVLGGFFATLRTALLRSHPPRVLARTRSLALRRQVEPLLARADSLATSAGIFRSACELSFATLLLRWLTGAEPVGGWVILKTLAIAVPAILLVTQALPTILALRGGDTLLLWTLPAFHLVQIPLHWLVGAVEGISRALMRVVGLRQDPATARQIVEGLREVIEDADISRDLDETEREIIGNVMEFRDVDVAAVMTPRTEIHGIEIREDLLAAARAIAECGHSRIPVYDGSLDSIVGIITARDVLQSAAERGLEGGTLRSILRPATFVPETKRVSELLPELRREKIKLAIVLDEYGGTAGLVTLADILGEIVGDIGDEPERDARQRIRRFPDGRLEVDASLRVSEVNGEIGSEIPEGADFETLAGFVLAELGRFPRRGESFVADGLEYTVLEASDRRVLKVGIRPARQEALA